MGTQKKDAFGIPDFLKEKISYQKRSIYDYDVSHEKMCTIIKFEAMGFIGFKNIISTILHYNKNANVKILDFRPCD